jgi:outer membrane protein OmpA-like peptidoglycan-associated protein
MKTSIALSGLLALATIHPAHTSELLPLGKGVTFLGGAATGMALGGPVGLLVGASTGAWYAQKLELAATAQTQEEQLTRSHTELAQLRLQLRDAQETGARTAELMLAQLELDLLFRTDSAELSTAGLARLEGIASFMIISPQLGIRLDGYADPRGSHRYNLALSWARAQHVEQVLRDLGVASSRIETYAHGATTSTSQPGDGAQYAHERSVSIRLQPANSDSFASTE